MDEAIAKVISIVAPVAESGGCELYDVEWKAGLLRVLVDRAGGIDLEVLATVSPLISDAIDAIVPDPFPGRYTLEISSPGVERPLRTPAHYQRQIGATVSVKTRVAIDGQRRFQGVVEAADAEGVTIGGTTFTYDQIEAAKSVFAWGSAGQKKKPTAPKRAATKQAKEPA